MHFPLKKTILDQTSKTKLIKKNIGICAVWSVKCVVDISNSEIYCKMSKYVIVKSEVKY